MKSDTSTVSIEDFVLRSVKVSANTQPKHQRDNMALLDASRPLVLYMGRKDWYSRELRISGLFSDDFGCIGLFRWALLLLAPTAIFMGCWLIYLRTRRTLHSGALPYSLVKH